MRGQRYQIILIISGFVATALFATFLYREIFPEYKIYQDDYIALEQFRSTYSGQPPAPFQTDVKQIVFEREDKGPAKIDRCISCHVAVQIPQFSPTKISHDINGNIVRSTDGTPVQIPNEEYIWAKLDQKIAELTDQQVNDQLQKEGKSSQVKQKIREAEQLSSLKTAQVGEHRYDVRKVLSMHPLIGKETRPFEYHSLEDYGCTSCHGGNGRGLTTEKAHGPVFDHEYEVEYMGPRPEFTEKDEQNDPRFASIFNSKPGDSLLFQTNPILPGALIQSNCIQCHQESATALQVLANSTQRMAFNKELNVNAIKKGFEDEKRALFSLLNIRLLIEQNGISGAIESLKQQINDLSLPTDKREEYRSQLKFVENEGKQKKEEDKNALLLLIDTEVEAMIGTEKLAAELREQFAKDDSIHAINHFLQENQEKQDAKGSLFVKREVVNLENALLQHVEDAQTSFSDMAMNSTTVAAMASDLDWLTKNYRVGEQLYLSQACYACHRIAGMSRGGVGPELTHAGKNYPWFLKQKIVWPQGDLKTSTMPNLRLDHVELENLMTFLLAQKGATKNISDTNYKIDVKAWEEGRKLSWEKPLSPAQVHNLRNSMTIFATQGCAACHRLQGFESNVGFKIEKEAKPDFSALYREREWFQSLFKEDIQGSSIVEAIDQHAQEIDQRIVDGVRKDSILEEIEKNYSDIIESMYANFRFASRAKNHFYQEIADHAIDPKAKQEALEKLNTWKQCVHRILMVYIQEYGFGHLIGPRPNWSGVYRSDEWLMEHFKNPSSHIPKSIMPVFPFDDSKFYALTYMLDVLGVRNRDAVHEIWNHKEFNPSEAFQIHCSQCHGEHLQGNGPIAEWIYPIPKNLRNPTFMLNLTRENAIQSIAHGVKGTPMPPWGETPKDKSTYDGIPVLRPAEIEQLVDWLFATIPGTGSSQETDVPKWRYEPKDVLKELEREGGKLNSGKYFESKESSEILRKNTPLVREQQQSENQFVAIANVNSDLENATHKSKAMSIFDAIPNPVPDAEEYMYYIKKRYYTKENIEKGRQFFQLNCAVCHGQEADGTGIRASVMEEAKPRMLTNLDWLKVRDDLRLLRSIKYGVPGTAMTPWGDLTSSLQRMQLVIYIRSLTEDKESREALSESVYRTFDFASLAVEKARTQEYDALETVQNELNQIKDKLHKASQIAESDPSAVSTASELYEKQLALSKQLKQLQKKDLLLKNLKKMILQEKEIYLGIGNDLIGANLEPNLWEMYLAIISLNEGFISFKEQKLFFHQKAKDREKIEDFSKQIIDNLDSKIQFSRQEKAAIEGRLVSPEREAALHEVRAKESGLIKLKANILSGLEKSRQLRKEEKHLIDKF
jgi:mono/diheme cytochrome c family protein